MNVEWKIFSPHSKCCCITFQLNKNISKNKKAEDRNSILNVLNCKIAFSKLFLSYGMMCWRILFVGGLILGSFFWSFSQKRQRKVTWRWMLASWPSFASSASSSLLCWWFSLWNWSSRRGPILRGSKMMYRWWVGDLENPMFGLTVLFKLLLNQKYFLFVR